MINQILFSTLGTIAFAITMKVPKKALGYIAAGALLTAATERVLAAYYGDFISCFSAMLCLAFFSEMVARQLRTPTTVIIMPSAIPLLPGSAIYNTMLYAIKGNTSLAKEYGISTLLAGLGIALGAVTGSTVVKIINSYRKSA